MLIADAAQLLHELRRRRNIAAFALNGLNKDGSTLFRRHDGLEDFVFYEPGAIKRVLRFRRALRAVIQVGERNVGHSRNQREEPAALLDLRCREGECAHSASMESAVEGDDALPLGVITG